MFDTTLRLSEFKAPSFHATLDERLTSEETWIIHHETLFTFLMKDRPATVSGSKFERKVRAQCSSSSALWFHLSGENEFAHTHDNDNDNDKSLLLQNCVFCLYNLHKKFSVKLASWVMSQLIMPESQRNALVIPNVSESADDKLIRT